MPGFTIDLEGLNLNNEQERAIQDDIRKAALARILDLRDIDQTQLQIDLGKLGNASFVGMIVRQP